MSPGDIKKIESHTKDSLLKWNILLAQQDRTALLAEVKRLRKENKKLREDKKCEQKSKTKKGNKEHGHQKSTC